MIKNSGHRFHMTLWVVPPYYRPLPAKFGGRGRCGWGDILLFIYHVTSHDYMIKGSCHFLCSSPLSYHNPPICQVSWSWMLWMWIHIVFGLPFELKWAHDQTIMQHFLLESLDLSHHPVKVGGRRRSGCGHISFFICTHPRDQRIMWLLCVVASCHKTPPCQAWLLFWIA